MTEINIVVKGRIPSKKNGKIMICRGTRPILISSAEFQAWNTEQLWLLKRLGALQLKEVASIDVTFYAPDKRKADLTNKVEGLMDLLVDAGILEDDNWFVVPNLLLHFKGVDTQSPRAEIIIQKTTRGDGSLRDLKNK